MLSEARRHVGDEVDHPAAEAPLVVVPADDLGALRAEHQGQRGVDDRRVRVALEVGGHQLLVADGQDAFQLAARGLVQRRVDVLHRRRLAELDDQLDAEILPRQLAWVLDAEELDAAAVDVDGVVLRRDRLRQGSECRVVLQQMGERVSVADVIDRDEIDVRIELERRTKDVAADATKAVDADLYSHATLRTAPLKLFEYLTGGEAGPNVRRTCGRDPAAGHSHSPAAAFASGGSPPTSTASCAPPARRDSAPGTKCATSPSRAAPPATTRASRPPPAFRWPPPAGVPCRWPCRCSPSRS